MPQSAPKETVLILGNYRTTLTVARTLAEVGFHVIVSEADDGAACARYSRYVDEMWVHPPLTENSGSAFRRSLGGLLHDRPEITAVFPVAEEYVVWLSQNRNVLPQNITLVSPEADLVELCLDKVRMLELASQAGIACAPYATVDTLNELRQRCREIGYPVIVRPFSHLNRIGHKKAVICHDQSELAAEFPAWPAGQPGLLLQRYVSGIRHDQYFIAVEGEIISLLETKITRTDHPDGTGLSTEGIHVPVTERFRQDTLKLVRETGYTGIGFVQFVQDPSSGEVTFLELNPRTAGSHRCAEAVGMPLTLAALRLARGCTDIAPDAEYSHAVGTYYAWSTGDLYGLKQAVSHREITLPEAFQWVLLAARTLLRARIHLTFSWRDPLPPFALLLRQSGKVIGRLADRFSGHQEHARNAGVDRITAKTN